MNKQEVIAELKERGLEIDEQSKLDELRRTRRENCKSKEQTAEGTAEKVMAEYKAKLEFKLGTDEWEEFVERIELYFVTNDIEDKKKKRALFLMKMDTEKYSAVRKVCAPKKPGETPLKEIITKMEQFLKPKVSVTVLRQRFRERKQEERESVIQFMAALRHLARECRFKEEEEALRDQFIMGIKSKAIKIALFKIEQLTLDNAIRTATAIEGAEAAIETGEQPVTGRDGVEKGEEN